MFRIIIFSAALFFFTAHSSFAGAAQAADKSVNGAAGARGVTLADCYALALKQSESIAMNAEAIKAAEARFLQAFSELLPHVSFSIAQTTQDMPVSSGSSSRNTSVRKFVFKQTLFSGFKEFASVSGSKLEHKQRENEKKRAEQLLLVDVSDAFYLLAEEKENLKTLRVIKDALVSRIDELKQRINLGRSRRSEMVNTQARFFTVLANYESAESQEIVARQLLEFLVGQKVDKILDEAHEENLGSLEEYLPMADNRPDVQAAKQAWEVDKKRVTVAKSGFFPLVTLENNRYTQKTTSPKDNEWDVLLKVEIPVFEGTETLGKVKESSANARSSELNFFHAKRSAVQDIRDNYVKYSLALSQAEAYQRALRAAVLNYHLQRKDYKYNLVNNLDVLAAIQSLEEARLDYIHALYESRRLYWQFKIATGEDIDSVRSFMKTE